MMLATTKDESSCAHRMMWKGRNGYAVGFTRVLRGAIVGEIVTCCLALSAQLKYAQVQVYKTMIEVLLDEQRSHLRHAHVETRSWD